MPTPKRSSKKVETPTSTSERRCSFRLVKIQARPKSSGIGPYAIEAQHPGGSAWTAGIVGLDLDGAGEQMRRLESSGCPIEYNEHFQSAVKKRR